LGANGFGSSAINVHSYDIYLKHLTTWGYVVIIVNDPQAGIPSGTTFTNVHNWFKSKYTDNTHWMSQYADSSKVIVGGHSNGGVNATSLLLNRPTEIDGIVYFASYPSSLFPNHDVSGYSGKVLDIAGTEDSFSTPSACKTGYNKYTSASCKVWALIQGLNHGGFGDYNNTSQPIGSIGRDSATASIRHYLLSFCESQFKNSSSAQNALFIQSNRPNTENEFLSNCITTSFDEMMEANVSLYPNPANNYFTIKIANNNHWGRIQLYNTLGQILLIEELEASIEKTISLNNLPSNIYFLHITQGEKTVIKKIVKN
jgi:pimeloyl-ACP methyl ester carboxylesterase